MTTTTIEEYARQVNSYSKKEVYEFNQTIENFFNSRDEDKALKEAVAFFYMKLHILENKETQNL